MANHSTKASANSAKAASKRPDAPPDDKFWIRYSQHHELPLSGVGSFTIHALLLGVLTLASLFGWFALLGLNKDSLPVDAISVRAGGGGDPAGISSGPGGKGNPLVENIETPKDDPNVPPYSGPALTEVPRAQVDPIEFPDLAKDPEGQRFIDKKNLALSALSKINRDAREQMMNGVAGDRGQGGSGKDGGKDAGKDKGKGDGKGEGKGKILTKREKRVLRWVMTFETLDGNDYARQLDALGAILGVPESNGQYRIIRDLKARPARGEIEDLNKIERIFWVDDKPKSVIPLAEALQLNPPPPHIVAFFPRKFEQELLRLELSYHRWKEEDIQETQFVIKKDRSANTYKPQVVGQIRR
jgi:hypothetical protein